MAARLAAVKPLGEALKNPDPASLEAATQALDNFRSAVGEGIVYLLDRQGTTLASSNRDAAESFGGKNYGFRPYSKEAIQGRTAMFIGIGVTSAQPGLYLSTPVADAGTGRILGAATLKLPLDEIADRITHPQYHGITTLTGPHGIIRLSNDQGLIGKFLG